MSLEAAVKPARSVSPALFDLIAAAESRDETARRQSLILEGHRPEDETDPELPVAADTPPGTPQETIVEAGVPVSLTEVYSDPESGPESDTGSVVNDEESLDTVASNVAVAGSEAPLEPEYDEVRVPPEVCVPDKFCVISPYSAEKEIPESEAAGVGPEPAVIPSFKPVDSGLRHRRHTETIVNPLPVIPETAKAAGDPPAKRVKFSDSPDRFKERNSDHASEFIMRTVQKNIDKYFDNTFIRTILAPLLDSAKTELQVELQKFYEETAKIYILVAGAFVAISLIIMAVSLYLNFRTYQKILGIGLVPVIET